MVSARALANTVLSRAFAEGKPVTPMKLQKILYFICRDYVQRYGRRLVSEDFLAWDYGPVLRSVYDDFKSYGSRRIDRFARSADGKAYVVNADAEPEVMAAVDDMWEQCRDYTGIELSKKTHKPGTAWYKAYTAGSACLNDEDIANDRIF